MDTEEFESRLPFWMRELHKIQEEIKKEKQQSVATDDMVGASCENK